MMARQVSTRELAMLTMMADGCTNQEMADELNVTAQYMAGTLMKNLFLALGAKNRANAVALGYHYGLLLPAVHA